jgi:anti-sigma regulatory factor (Ser/Thr protein kinase)
VDDAFRQLWSYARDRRLKVSDVTLDAVPGHAAVLAYRDDSRRVRAFVTEHASSAGAAPRRVGDLVLAVGELTANTYRHTSGGGTVSIWATGDELIGQVKDSGHIGDPLAGRRIPAPDQGGAREYGWCTSFVTSSRSGPAPPVL